MSTRRVTGGLHQPATSSSREAPGAAAGLGILLPSTAHQLSHRDANGPTNIVVNGTYTNAGTITGADGSAPSFTGGTAVDLGSGVLTKTNTGVITGGYGGYGVASGGIVYGACGAAVGDGRMAVGASSALMLQTAPAAGQTVDFTGRSGVLALGTPIDFAGRIVGFGGSDKVDLLDTAATGFRFAHGTLSVLDGTTKVAQLHFGAGYRAADFVFASDGNDGVYVMSK